VYFFVWILRYPPLESGKYSTSMQYLSPGIGLFRVTPAFHFFGSFAMPGLGVACETTVQHQRGAAQNPRWTGHFDV
jgi:hypothetical protein